MYTPAPLGTKTSMMPLFNPTIVSNLSQADAQDKYNDVLLGQGPTYALLIKI